MVQVAPVVTTTKTGTQPPQAVPRVPSVPGVAISRRPAVQVTFPASLASGPTPARWSAPIKPSSANFWHAVRSLPRRQAQPLALSYLESRSGAEIAQVSGCSEANVRANLRNGQRALSKRLGISAMEER